MSKKEEYTEQVRLLIRLLHIIDIKIKALLTI